MEMTLFICMSRKASKKSHKEICIPTKNIDFILLSLRCKKWFTFKWIRNNNRDV